jgi:serine/threonine protein kinase
VLTASDFGSSVNSVQLQHGGGGGDAAGDSELLLRGTSWYLAPEAARGQVQPANDIWSVGVTFLEMITGKQPWTFRGTEA